MNDMLRLSNNERLFLAQLRRDGPQPRAVLAQPMGLSAQTVTNISRRLIDAGLVSEGALIRGKVGQPLTPLALDPNGAFFLGLKLGRRLAELALVDFTGQIRTHRQEVQSHPHPDRILSFTRKGIAAITASMPREARDRIVGVGIAAPFRLWDWGAEMQPWEGRDLAAELRAAVPFPVVLENDASTACGGELLFGTRDLPADFLHFYIAHYAGGGLVLDGRLRLGPNRNAAAVGSMPLPGGGQLLDIASVATLEARLGHALPPDDAGWADIPAAVLNEWIGDAAAALAQSALAATALCDLSAIVIDGALPTGVRAALVAETGAALARLDTAGLDMPLLCEGSLGRNARILGAASLPLAATFLPDG